MSKIRYRLHFHWPLFWVTVLLVLVGLMNLHSATYSLSEGGVSSYVWSQLAWIGVGSFIVLLLLFVDYRVFFRISYPLYFSCIGLLILVIFFGKTIAGNRSWLSFGLFNFQPGEFAKLAVVIALARFLSDAPPQRQTYYFSELIIPGLLILAPTVLIALGNDMGSAIFLLFVGASILLFVGVQKKLLLILFLLTIFGGIASYQFVLSPHQRSRIQSFLNPTEDPQGKGYHLLQSKITVGSGRLIGKGYLKGLHSKLQYLPERHTDFIFPVLAEEWGFLGAFFVLGLYSTLLLYGIQIASKAKERFGVFLGLGIVMILFWQLVINLGGVLGLMPLTGVTLPLLSYGGSSIVMILIAIGLLMNISIRRFMF